MKPTFQDMLRDIRLIAGETTYRLQLSDETQALGREGEPAPTGWNRTRYGYRLTDYSANPVRVIFEGADYWSPAIRTQGQSDDGDHAVLGLLGFLTLKPGDTDSEYFEGYTADQLDWAKSSDCEELSYLVYDAENEGRDPAFRDWQDG